ncbi:hypothetical protein JTB14_020301 [Gonioctena quinquepunctata]|nr:hypothetical protein JTB14_020301 [Gonioctena quinquepunctata]
MNVTMKKIPNKFKREAVGVRGPGTEEAVEAAISDVKTNNMSINKAAILHDILKKTLERRLGKNIDKKGAIGPSSLSGPEKAGYD